MFQGHLVFRLHLAVFLSAVRHASANLPDDLELTIKPILFSALLNHWGHKGPRGDPVKTALLFYRFFKWQTGQKRGAGVQDAAANIPSIRWPPLRLALLAGRGSNRR